MMVVNSGAAFRYCFVITMVLGGTTFAVDLWIALWWLPLVAAHGGCCEAQSLQLRGVCRRFFAGALSLAAFVVRESKERASRTAAAQYNVCDVHVHQDAYLHVALQGHDATKYSIDISERDRFQDARRGCQMQSC